MGKPIIFIGCIVVVIGLLIQFTSFNLNWFGKLPGDIHIQRSGFSFFMPITSMIIISIVGSGLLWLYRRFFS
ncbi:DUF2905 domain-containing protein [Myroides marinus]|uniref:DUF2905 domain-containing protein n=1 Tax=Myroides marinus TaxID=703342 RepID=UPI0009B8858A|nr:DUF2905 domain-containing protein [Myroides marinus]MDM1362554.1 DUF2905 domain-containing protein [Myroides marinus]MDM1373002.1 DUF2905 domain-containing protein [Myroides marinus]MDM1376640.1 DUF2905 domain-containing protein [Myroides marinus]MDM1380333.1 DUF2905 domain-containing protein [Myroides marinus]MDM1387605.1 DUF2905 domain-containing protein [Myroides marinus]